ncbi:hypothetical protein ACSSS7_000766 [Eimeria intestinalis]
MLRGLNPGGGSPCRGGPHLRCLRRGTPGGPSSHGALRPDARLMRVISSNPPWQQQEQQHVGLPYKQPCGLQRQHHQHHQQQHREQEQHEQHQRWCVLQQQQQQQEQQQQWWVLQQQRGYTPPSRRSWSKQNEKLHTRRPLVEAFAMHKVHPTKQWWREQPHTPGIWPNGAAAASASVVAAGAIACC